MLMEDSSAMITALLVICAILQAAAVGGIMILLWALFSRLVFRETPAAIGATTNTISIDEGALMEGVAATYETADPWDELRIDRDEIRRRAQTIPSEEDYKS